MLPDTLLAGLPKCGTTALFHWFDRRPDVFVPAVKEPHLLADLTVSGIGDIESYAALYADATELRRVDCSTSSVLHAERVIANVERYEMPIDTALIVYRNPVERCISHWNYARKIGQDDRSLAEVAGSGWGTPNDPWGLESAYVEPGLLAPGLLRLIERFPRVRVLPYSAMRADPEAFLAEVCRALDVPAGPDDSTLEERNVSLRPRGIVGAGVLRAANAVGATSVAWPRPVRSVVRRAFVAGSADLADGVDDDNRFQLEGCFAADQAELRAVAERHPDVFPMPMVAEWVR